MEELKKLPVSWTSMSMWNTCTYKWYLRYVLKLRTTKISEALSKGRIAHDLLHHHHQFCVGKDNKQTIDESVANHRAYVQEYMTQVDPRETTLLFHVSYVIEQFITIWQPEHEDKYLTVATEIEINQELETSKGNLYVITGFIDRILFNQRSRKLINGEYKTHNARPWSDSRIEMDGQQLLYLWLARMVGWEVADVLYLFINTYEYKDRNKQPYTKYFDSQVILDKPNALKGFQQEVESYVDEVFRFQGERPRRRLGSHCSTCQFQPYCYATLKGVSSTSAMQLGYTRTEDKPLETENE